LTSAFILGDETDMNGPGIGAAMPQPKEYPAVAAEALQIWVALRTPSGARAFS
jgi:hypothetical protein